MSFATPNKPPDALNPGAPENINQVNANFLAIENILDEGITYKDHFEQSVKGLYSYVYNAADFGTFGTWAAIQSAIDQCQTDGGGTVYVPLGEWTGTTGMTIAHSVPVRLLGAGMVMNPSGVYTGGTVLTRSSGTDTVLSVNGTAFATRGWAAIENLSISGGNTAGRGIDLQRCQNTYLHRVRVADCAHQGIRCTQLFNSSMDNVFVHACGSLTQPALLFDAASEDQGGSATVHCANVEIEGSNGIALRLDGYTNSTTIFSPTNDVRFVNLKIEAGTVAAAALAVIDLPYSQSCSFANCNIYGTNTTTSVIQQAHPFGTDGANSFFNCNVTGGGSSPYGIKNTRGAMTVANTTVLGVATAAIRLESTVSAGRFHWATIHTNAAQVISDARVVFLASAATLTLPHGEEFVLVNGTADVTSITASHPGRRVTLWFDNTAATNGVVDGSNLKLAGNLAYTPNDTLSLVCDGTNWLERGRSVN